MMGGRTVCVVCCVVGVISTAASCCLSRKSRRPTHAPMYQKSSGGKSLTSSTSPPNRSNAPASEPLCERMDGGAVRQSINQAAFIDSDKAAGNRTLGGGCMLVHSCPSVKMQRCIVFSPLLKKKRVG